MLQARFDDGVCGVCARPETGLGYFPTGGRRDARPLWLCDDPECIQIAKDTYSMRQDQFSRLDSLAAQEGGAEAGQFLDEIGETDLSKLTIDQFCEFCRRLVGGYRKALKTTLRNEAPF